MTTVTSIYAFTRPDSESLGAFLALAERYSDSDISLRIGVATEDSFDEYPHVVTFSTTTSESEMLNQLVAASTTDVCVLNDGAAFLKIAEEFLHSLPNLCSGSYVVFDGRRPTSTHDLDDSDSFVNSVSGEFGRGFHAESPLSFAISRKDFMHVRGFDERTAFESSRTMDLLARLKRSGMRRIDAPYFENFAVDMGASFPQLTHEKIPLGVSMRENQKAQVQSDSSIFRNLERWSVSAEFRPTLVSVAIATRDRAAYLADCIRSVLAQTFQEFELIIVDDGSEDHTEQVVRAFSDQRVKYHRQEAKGISAARNLAADVSVGRFTAVHDDDDIMLPWRLQTSLQSISASAHASYGSWVNFDDVSGEMALHITKLDFGRDLVAFSGQTPGHATWLLPTTVVRNLRYDETLTSSVDHNLAVRTILSGLQWKHTEKVLFLRRLHPTQVSQTDARRQRAAAVLSRYANSFTADFNGAKAMTEHGKSLKFPAPADKKRLFESFGPYLPDHLVSRSATIQGLVGKKVLALDIHDRFQFIAAEIDLLSGKSTLELGGISEVTWPDMVLLRRLGIVGYNFTARRRKLDGSVSGVEVDGGKDVADIIADRQGRELQRFANAHPAGVLVRVDKETVDLEDLRRRFDVVSAKHFSVNHGVYERESFVLLGFRDFKYANHFTSSLREDGATWRILAPGKRDFSQLANDHLRIV